MGFQSLVQPSVVPQLIISLGNTPAATLVVLLIIAVMTWIAYVSYFSPLSSVPGPFLARFSRAWIMKHSRDGDMHRIMIDLHRRAGKLVRIGPNELSVSDPAAIELIYDPDSKSTKSAWYSIWHRLWGEDKFDLFAERDEVIHVAQQNRVCSAYSVTSLKDLQLHVDTAILKFMSCLEERMDTAIDLGYWLQLFSYDAIALVTFSKRIGFLDKGTDFGYFAKTEANLRLAAWVGQVPWLYRLFEYLEPCIGRHLDSGKTKDRKILDFVRRNISARKDKGVSNRRDVLGKLLTIQNESPEETDSAAIQSMTSANIIQGGGTVALSLCAIFHELLQNPECLQRLLAEIDSKWQTGYLSDPVRMEEAAKMPYLQAVLYEALRLHPAVGMSLPRVVPEGGVRIDGQWVPAGTVVGINPWVIHRDQQLFGDGVDDFNPERWLAGKDRNLYGRFFAFGAGSRTCLGKNIAWMELSKLVPTLLFHYDFELTSPEERLYEKCWWFVIPSCLTVKIRKKGS